MADTAEQIRDNDEDYKNFRKEFVNTPFDLANFEFAKSRFEAFVIQTKKNIGKFNTDMIMGRKGTAGYLYGQGTPGENYKMGALSGTGALNTKLQDMATRYEADMAASNTVIAYLSELLDINELAKEKLYAVVEDGLKQGWGAQFSKQQYVQIEKELGGVRDGMKKINDMMERMKPPELKPAPPPVQAPVAERAVETHTESTGVKMSESPPTILGSGSAVPAKSKKSEPLPSPKAAGKIYRESLKEKAVPVIQMEVSADEEEGPMEKTVQDIRKKHGLDKL